MHTGSAGLLLLMRHHRYPIGRTRSTPREAITDRKRQGSRLKEEIKEEDETVSIQESRKESMTARKNSRSDGQLTPLPHPSS